MTDNAEYVVRLMKWHYDEGYRIHDDCGGEVWYLEDGYICSRCGEQQDEFSELLNDG